MAAEEKWYFTKEQLANTPSRRCGFDADRELSNRQQAANFIQDMGQRLQVTQLCINTAIVYMHRFYVYHSFTHFHRNAIATAALFLAAKVEEQPRKLEHVIKVAHVCLHREPVNLDPKSDNYLEQAQDLVFNENVLLQTLSFDVAIDHPHTHVVRCCHMVKASKDLAQTSYFMASNSLHLTTMCLQYKPTVVACFCIHLACKWSNWEIPQSNEGKDWFSYVDKTVTFDQLEQLTTEFLQIFDKCPTKLKRKIMSITATQNAILPTQSAAGSQLFDNEPRKIPETQHSRHPLLPAPSSPHDSGRKSSSGHKGPPPPATSAPQPPPKVVQTYDQYKEKKERERVEREGKHGQPKEHSRESHHGKPPSHPSKPHPSMAPPPAAPSAAPYYPSRPVVTASRDQARRDQAHAREMSKRDMQHPQQQPSIFSPQPTAPAVDPPVTADSSQGHAPGGTVSSKSSSQEWQEKSANHSNELDANRHHSDKYNNLVKDSNRNVDSASAKRPHSKDHRLQQPPPGDGGSKLSLEESQRMHNSKYGAVRKGEGEGRPHEQDRHESQKRSGFVGQPGPPPLKQRGEFGHKKDESRSAGSGSNKQSGVSGHHASAAKSQQQPPPPHRVPQPPPSQAAAAAPSANHRAVPSPQVPASNSRPVQHSAVSQSSRSVPPPVSVGRVPAVASAGGPAPQQAAGASRVATNPTNPQQRSMAAGGSQHRGPSPFPPAAPQRPKSPRSQSAKVSDSAGSDVKPHNTVHQSVPSVKLESRNGSMHPTDDTKRPPPRDVVFRPELIKTEPIEQRPVSLEISRGQADAFRSDSVKLEDHKVVTEPVRVKVESDTLSTSTLPAAPKSSINNSRSTTLAPASNSSRESSHTHRTPTKPSSRHHTPPSNRRPPPELNLAPRGPMSPPNFGAPLLPLPTTPGKQQPPPLTPGSNSSSRSQHRNRTVSSSSEPELIPYMPKIEDIAGYEGVLGTKKGIKLPDKLSLPGRVPDIIQPIRDRVKEEVATTTTIRPVMNSVSKELKPPDLIRPFPVSQLPDTLFQANSADLGAVAFPVSDVEINGVGKSEPGPPLGVGLAGAMDPEYIKTIIEPSKLLNMPSALSIESPTKPEHRHKSEKKKKKEKHKHKEKDKDKPKEERKKKHKHKDKDKHKDKELPHGSAPIRITIPKEKILSTTIDTNSPPSQGLKIKILKDRLKGSEMTTATNSITAISSPVAGSGGLKLKISKDIIETYTTPMATKKARKRELELMKASAATSPEEARPAKAARLDPKKPSPAAVAAAPMAAAPTSSYVKPNGVRSGLHGKMEPTGGSKGSTAGSKPSH